MASLDLLLTRVADQHHFNADPTSHLDAIWIRHFTLIPNQIQILLIKVLRNGDHWFTDPTGLSLSLHASICEASTAHAPRLYFENLKLLNFNSKEDPDEDSAFHSKWILIPIQLLKIKQIQAENLN
jgi:hypothetical protein